MLKFRIWDKELEEWLYSTECEFFNDSVNFRLNKHTENIRKKIYLYTGANDINNKEIYEDSYVVNERKGSEGNIVICGKVKMYRGCWCIYNKDNNTYYKLIWEGSKTRVLE